MRDVLLACQEASGRNATYTWVDEAFLLAEKVQPWSQLPLWVPSEDPETAGFNAISITRALATGLTFRPFLETARDTLNWECARPAEREWRAGMSAEDEARLLKIWHERSES
jgi:2'-hydroxyisoflavone reductase